MTCDRSWKWILVCAVWSLLAAPFGCAPWSRSNKTIVRVDASRDSAKASQLTQVGIRALDHGHGGRAKEKFLAATAADSSFGPAHNNLGLVLFDEGDLYRAVLSFERAADLMPNDAAVIYNLALALESGGRTFEAMELYRQANAMDPTNAIYLGNLVRLRVRLEEHDPELISQLQDLVLIETRPQWRHWADEQLALYLNPMLDRGPATPEFDPSRPAGQANSYDDGGRIIDLNPEPQAESETMDFRSNEDVDSAELPELPRTLHPPSSRRRPVSPQPVLPGLDDQIETLPHPEPIPIRTPRTIDSLE